VKHFITLALHKWLVDQNIYKKSKDKLVSQIILECKVKIVRWFHSLVFSHCARRIASKSYTH